MRVEQLVVGQLQANCYLVWDEKTSQAIIIDPGDDGDFIIRRIQDFNLEPKLIIATHGHFDHILAVTELKLAFNIPFLINQADLFLLNRASRTAQFFMGVKADPSLPTDKFVKEGDRIDLGNLKLSLWETPGHTPGGISILGEKIIFSGDSIFRDGYGRTDFSYASRSDLEKSIKKILKLPPETIIYPGHGQETSVKEVKENFSF